VQGASQGLAAGEAQERLRRYGANILPRSLRHAGALKIFFSQFKSPLISLLIAAGFVSAILGEVPDTIVIAITAAMNVAVGFFQEYKANNALSKLQELVQYSALVVRGGSLERVRSEQLVVGDVILLEAGDKVPADARLIESLDLEVNEAPLTGESEPVKKQTRKVALEAVLAERTNMVYHGTLVANGRGRAVVAATGRATEIGRIAELVRKTEEQVTPLQRALSNLSRRIGYAVLALSAAIFVLGLIRAPGAYSYLELFKVAVAIAVAAIPEGLPISLTVILAVGMQYLVKRQALVRRLLAAETLGSVSVICTDKTGTLTEGIMRVTRVITAREQFDRDELATLRQRPEDRHRDALLALRIAVLANNAVVQPGRDGASVYLGDTTETALAEQGQSAGLDKDILDKAFMRLAEVPFDSRRKFMATLHRVDHETALYAKGAFEALLPRLGFYEENGRPKKLSPRQLEWFLGQEAEFSGQGLRVLAVAYKLCPLDKKTLADSDVDDLTLVGFIALSDPLRVDVKNTIERAKSAGIRVVMITGDHERTAEAIGRELGLVADTKSVLNGKYLKETSDAELSSLIERINVFARIDPADKIRIVQAWQKQGQIVAMTGDGVNDSPALKAADIGVAVGSGTDIAKQIADLVLLDDRFSTIIAAVEEGRRIYQNIQKVLLYLLSFSLAEVALIAVSLAAGWPLALLPAQILWLNLVQDTFPAVSLAFDAGDPENMKDLPRPKGTRVLTPALAKFVALVIGASSILLIVTYGLAYRITQDEVFTRTIVFAALGVVSLFVVYPVRSLRRGVWQIAVFSNRYLTAAVLFGIVMLVAAIYLPPLQTLLGTVPLPLTAWGIIAALALAAIGLIEAGKRLLSGRLAAEAKRR